MTRPIHLSVIGVPEPMGSKRGFVHNGRARIVDAKSASLRSWQSAIAQAGRDHMANFSLGEMAETSNGVLAHLAGREVLDEPLAVRACFYLPRPQSAPRWRVWPDKRPDVDKCLRAVLDPLTGILWRDDSLVVRVKCDKRYADDRPPGVDITITPLGRQVSPRARARLLSEEG